MAVARNSFPFDAGEVVWIEFGPPVGHEQSGRRPGLVLSPRAYNERSSLVVVCPITRNERQWPFKIPIPPVGRITGFVLLDQMRSVDPSERFFGRAGRIPDEALRLIRTKLAELLAL